MSKKRQAKKIDEVQEQVNKLEFDIPLYGIEAKELSSHVKRKGTQLLGGKSSNAYKDNKIRYAVYSDIYNQLKRQFGLYDENGRFRSYEALSRKNLQQAHSLVDTYELPIYLNEQISNANAQITFIND